MSLIACVPFMADTVADACKETVQNCLVTTDFTNITQGTGGPTNKYCQLSAKTLYYNLKLPENCHKLSVAFWFYGINYGYAWQDVFSFSTQRADNQQTLLRFESYGNGNYGIFNNGHMSWDIVGEPVYDLQNKWTHLVFTIERTQTGTFSQYYENGILKWQNTKSYTESGDVKFYNTDNNFRIGEADLVFNVSDFRVYDHILSQKEVSDIYNRLMVQYQFGSVAQNLTLNSKGGFDYTGFNSSSSCIGGSPDWATLSETYKGLVVKRWRGSTTAAACGPYTNTNSRMGATLEIGQTYTISAYIKSDVKSSISNNFAESQTILKKSLDTYPYWTRIWAVFTATSTSFNSCMYINGGLTTALPYVYACGYKIEQGDKSTEYTDESVTSSIEDSSGHGFTGNITGSLITTSDSALGLTSGYFNGSTVLYNNTSAFNFTDNFSWNIWVKHKGLYTGNATYIFTNGRADAGGYGYGMFVTDDNNVQTQFGNSTSGNMACAKNEWHMVSMTVSGTTVKSYVDGELRVTKTVGTKPTYSDGNGLGLGCFHYTGDIYYSQSNIDDFRIYGKTLSDEEIKSLYTDKIELDNSYKLHSVEVIEDNNKVELTKESLVKCNEIYECGDEVRYIKFESNGSNKNSGNHLSRLIIYDMNNTEELILDSSIKLMPTVTSGSCVWADATWFDLSTSVTFDLGKIKKLTRMNVRRYWNDGRYYYATKIQVSKDNTNWVDVWVSGNTGSYGDDKTYNTYTETINGKDYLIPNNKYQIIDNNLSEYTQLEYIESTSFTHNTNYIDTGFKPNQDTSIEMTVYSVYNDYDALYGSSPLFSCQRESGTGTNNIFNKWNNAVTMMYVDDSKPFTIKQFKNIFYINNTAMSIQTATSWSDTNNLRLFSITDGDRDGIFKLFSCQIYDGNNKIRDFIPAKRNSDNVIGLYDKLNNKFYTNSGTGTFLSGKEIDNKDIIMNEFIEE